MPCFLTVCYSSLQLKGFAKLITVLYSSGIYARFNHCYNLAICFIIIVSGPFLIVEHVNGSILLPLDTVLLDSAPGEVC